MKKLAILVIFAAASILGLAAVWFVHPPRRVVKTARMEECLRLYKNYRQDTNQKRLAEGLALISLKPYDFQQIIDRFIYYRSQKSAMQQAMKLLKAFRMGYDVKVQVYSMSGYASEPFRLDAEILAVFESKPNLITQAFEG